MGNDSAAAASGRSAPTASLSLGGSPVAGERRLPSSLCPALPAGWVFVDQGERLIFHARPSPHGRPTLEVTLAPDGSLRIAATAAREALYEQAALTALHQQLTARAETLAAYLRQRQWLRARLDGASPLPDPLDPAPSAFGETPAARDLWARALLRLALTPPPGLTTSALLARTDALAIADTRALAATVAITTGTLAALDRDRIAAADDPWIDAVLGCWLGDFARVDAALRRLVAGDLPRRVEIAAQLYAESGAADLASALAQGALAALPHDDPTTLALVSFVDPQQPIPDLAQRVAAADPADAVQLESVAQTLRERGELKLARQLYGRGLERWPDDPRLLTALAELQLWSGAYDDAAASIGRLAGGQPVAAAALDAARYVASGTLDKAEAIVRTLPRSGEEGAHQALLEAEILVRRGHYPRARRLLAESSGTQGLVAARLLAAMCAIRCGDAAAALADEEEEIGWVRRGELAALTPAEPADVGADPEPLYGRLERALQNLRGNRSATPTVLVDGALRYVPRPPDLRDRAVAVLFGILHRPPAQVLGDFAALLAAYPRSAQAYCYRGELLLWLGRYDDAERDFAAARDISRLRRWAYVGLAAVALMRGELRQTLAIGASCEKACGRNDAATLGVYAGEAHRRLGHRWRAARTLDAVIAAKPSRLAARINRALVDAGRSGARARDDIWQQVGRALPGLAIAARVTHPDDADVEGRLETCLSRMLGNRSSTIATYLDADERWRVRALRVDRLTELTAALHRECLLDFFKA